jgi:hypothetical protein
MQEKAQSEGTSSKLWFKQSSTIERTEMTLAECRTNVQRKFPLSIHGHHSNGSINNFKYLPLSKRQRALFSLQSLRGCYKNGDKAFFMAMYTTKGPKKEACPKSPMA